MAAVDEKEFTRWMELLRSDVKGVHDRLDELNGRTRKNENAIAVLEDRSTDGRSEGRKSGAVWGGFAGGFAMVALWLAEKLWK